MPKQNIQDKRLIAGILKGGTAQERMIRHIYKAWFHYVKLAIRKHNLHEDEALDAYTDAVLVLRQHVVSGRFRGDSKISTYLYRIFFNKCIDVIRKNTTKRLEYSFEFPIHLQDKSPNITHLLQITQDYEMLKGYLDQLGEPCRQIIMDAHFWGYRMEEIAHRIKFKDAQSVRSRKYTCIKQLLKLIKSGKTR